MSRITGSEVRSMMEAYTAVYAPQITEQQIQEDFENWVYSLVDEGEDLSGYTWDEMYEAYNYINEQVAGEMGGTGLGGAALAGMGSLAGGIGYYGAKAINAAQTLMSRGKSKPKQQGGGFANAPRPSASDNKVAQGQASATAANNPKAKSKTVPRQEISGTPPTGQKPRVTVNNTGTSTSSGGGGTSSAPKPPEPPKPAPKPPEPPKPATFGDAIAAVKNAVKPVANAVKPVANAANQVLGKPARDRFLGTTVSGKLTRAAATTGLSALDIGGKAYDPTKPSALSKIGSIGPGAVGTVLQGFGNAGLIKDTSMGTGARGTGSTLRQIGRDMRDQKPKYKYENYSVDFDTNQYINEKKVLAKKGNTWVSVETDPSGNKKETELKSNEINPEAIKRYNSLATQKAKQQATQATNQRTSLGVVDGGKSGYTVSTSDKPKAGETTQQWQSRRSEGLKLADTLNKDRGLGKYRTTTPAPGTTPPRTTPAPGTTSPAATKPAPTSPVATKPSPSKPAIERSPQGYAVGTTAGGTKFERRAATGAELRAAQEARQKALASAPTDTKGAEEAAVKAGVQRSQPTTGPASATVKPAGGTSTLRDMSKYPLKPAPTPTPTATPVPARNGFGAPTAGANAAASVSSATAPDVTTSNKIAAMNKQPDVKPQQIKASYEYDAYDLVLEYLLNNGHVDTLDEALYVMMEMDVETIGTIVEDGFNSSGRYDVGGGRTVGPVAGAIRSLFTGNLPKQRTYIPPSPRQGTNTPPAVPPSKDDSGKSTDFGAGGGKAKMKTGMTVGQVERQGRMNKGDYSG